MCLFTAFDPWLVHLYVYINRPTSVKSTSLFRWRNVIGRDVFSATFVSWNRDSQLYLFFTILKIMKTTQVAMFLDVQIFIISVFSFGLVNLSLGKWKLQICFGLVVEKFEGKDWNKAQKMDWRAGQDESMITVMIVLIDPYYGRPSSYLKPFLNVTFICFLY